MQYIIADCDFIDLCQCKRIGSFAAQISLMNCSITILNEGNLKA